MKTIGRPILLALLAGVLTLPAAEPRYQLRSLIQNDGSLMHIRLDTETGKTWRLERFLKNRISTTVAGKILQREINADDQQQLITESLNQFKAAQS